MQLTLNLVSSVSIKRKKPWPKLFWLGKDEDGLFVLNGKCISQLYFPSGKTKKKIPKLHCMMKDVCALNVSQNGQFLCGALYDGKIFVWDRDEDNVRFITGLPKLFNEADKGNAKNRIFLSSCANMILLMLGFEKVFLWQKTEENNSDDSHNILGTWSQVHCGEYPLPEQSNKEAMVDGVFYSDEVVGRCGVFSYVFNRGAELAVTTLTAKCHDGVSMSNLAHNIPNQDEEIASREVFESMRCSIKWKFLTRPLYGLTPAARLVKGRFVYVCRYSPDGQMLAVVLNQKLAKNTRLMFCSTLHSTTSVVDMKCCGGSESSSGRVWWISDISWTADSLFLIGITRNGALFVTSKLGEPMNIVTTGYGVDPGPNVYLSLHPRISVRSFQENIPPETSDISTGSDRDLFHQTFSVAVHPSLPLLLCSDGYMVTIFQFNSKPDYPKLIRELTKDISRLLRKDDISSTLGLTFGSLEKSAHGASETWISRIGMNTGEVYSSPGSTLSDPGFGIARHLEAGVITFGDTESKKNNLAEELTEQQKVIRSERVLLQALGIGTSCCHHWSQEMPVAMNLVIHTWVKLFTSLLEGETSLSEESAFVHNIMTFLQTCFETFRWDIPYHHCLPWFTQFTHSTVKCLVSSKKFGFEETVELCMKILRVAEVFLHEIYAWSAVGNWATVHYLGDSFSPSSYVCVRNGAMQQSSDIAGSVYLNCKLSQSWLTLYHYVCKMYKFNLKKHNRGEKIVNVLCWIQKKLQNMELSRNLISENNAENFADQGYKMYLAGNYLEATDLLKKSFHKSSENASSTAATEIVAPRLQVNITSSEQPLVSSFGATLIEDLFSELSENIETLLSILYINLENYDLKAALALVYSFINTIHDVNLLDVLESRHEGSLTLIPADDSEVKVTSSSSLNIFQMSVLVNYPLAWIVDNRAVPLVQHMAKFMACYFINLPLAIPAPFQSQESECILAISRESNLSKMRTSNVKNLSQLRVTEAIGCQKVEGLWTADHTMELLLVSGLIGEAAWFANCLGDWKIAFLLAVTETFRKENQSFIEEESHDHATIRFEIPQPETLMTEKLNMMLKLNESSTETDSEGIREIFEDEHIASLENLLEASVVAELDLVPGIISQLVSTLKISVSKLTWMVAQDLYLPAPPLYCPQPARNGDDVLSEEARQEMYLRAEITNIVQKILVVLRASRCFLYCTQGYCKYVVTQSSFSNAELPNVIKELATTEGVDIHGDSHSGVIRSFQEFCCLMWLLDVRNELALSSRRYNKLKQNLSLIPNEEQTQDVINQCEDVLVWLKRLLPFSDFLDATDEVLDGILTMLSELPLSSKTVDLVAQYFHTPSSSLSLTTSEKLNRMTRKIRNSGEHVRLEASESLAVRYQQQCEKYRNESIEVPAQSSQNYYLELPPAFCGTLAYQHDFAFLSFLDTFLLITLAKTVSSEDYQKIPFILPYRDKPNFEAEPSPFETTTRLNEKNSRKSSFAIHRSQSFQDVGDAKAKVGSSELLSSDNLDSRKFSPVNRSHSLTDLRKLQSSKFSQELQEFLPKLLWLKRWCLVDENKKIPAGANKSYSFLNMSAALTAIRVQFPLKLVVNTLWLTENYYKEFSQSKGRCVREKRTKKNKRLSRKEVLPTQEGKEILPNTGKQKLDDKLALLVESGEDVDQVEGSRKKDGSEKTARVKRKGMSKSKDSNGKNERANELEIGRKEFDERIGHEGKLGGGVELRKTNVKENEVKEVEKELSVQRLRKPTENNVHVARFLDQKEEEFSSQGVDQFYGCPSKELETSMTESPEYQIEPALDKRSHESASTGRGGQTDEGRISDNVLFLEDASENIRKRSRFRKNSFSSPSSVDSKWKSVESVGEGLPLFSFSLIDHARSTSCVSKSSSRMVSESGLSNASETGVVGSFPSLYYDDASLSSESLSIGQMRSDVAAHMKIAGNVSSEASVTNGRHEKTILKQRKTAKRKTQDESSSYLSAEKTRVKPIDEGSLLRRIIRSEMRKFIKVVIANPERISTRPSKPEYDRSRRPDEAHETKKARSRNRMNKRSSLEPSTSYDITREEKTSKSIKQRTMRPRVGNIDLADENLKSVKSTSYQTLASEGESLNCSSRSHQSEISLRDAVIQHDANQGHPDGGDTSQQPPEMSDSPRNPSKISQASQIPAQPHMYEHMSVASGHHLPPGWPFWYNPSFSVPWLYMQPNAAVPPQNPAVKVNNDKGIQVEDNGTNQGAKRNSSVISPSSEARPALNQDDVRDVVKDAIVDAAVQTDTYFEELETSTIEDLAREKLEAKKFPFLLCDVRKNDQALSDTAVNEFPCEKEQISVTSDDGEKDVPRHHDVFASGSSTRGLSSNNSFSELGNEDKESASAVDNRFSIPLLEFPTEIRDPAPQPLPFKIAWPEHTEIQSSGPVQELPLLQLNNEQSSGREPFPLPTTVPSTSLGRLENAPLLHFANENNGNVGFRFVQMPAHENTQLPLLFLPETRADPSNLFSEGSRFAGDPKKGKSRETLLQKRITNDGNFSAGGVGETSKARMKRRNQLTGNVTAEQTTLIQKREAVLKQTSSDSPASETYKTIQDCSMKRKPRRDKLKELNNLIRDLQRDVSNDDDLVVSEVSSILSPEIRYENFEARQIKKKDNKDENTRKLPMTSENINRRNERRIDDEKSSVPKKTKASRLYKQSGVSARDIHTEVPSDVQEQSFVLDAKVGTVNILRFPASVQTENVVSPLETFNNLSPSPRKMETREPNVLTTELTTQTKAFNVQTKELSVQTELEVKAPVSSTVCDAAVNTAENVIDEPREKNNSNVSVYPRVPVDVYLNVQDINPSGTTSVLCTEERKFLSVVDIAEDDVKRQIQDKKERIDKNEDKNDQKRENIKFDKDSKVENGIRILTPTADEVPSDVGKHDRSTAAIFSSMEFQTSSFKEPTRRYNSAQLAQKISKEKLSRRLLDMNEQFDAIEQLTSNMEQDLLRSNRLLRTIENLNEVSDHASMPEVKKQEKTVGQQVERAIERDDLPSHRKKIPGTVDFAGDEMNEENLALRRNFDEGKKSYLSTRPWVNKPIEELTAFTPNDHTDERSVDSLEEDGITKSDSKDVSDSHGRPDIAPRDSITNKDIRGLETDGHTIEGIQSPNTGFSNSSTFDHEKLDHPEMSRLKLSVTPEDALNISRNKLKERLAGTTTQTSANSLRSRDKTPRKQIELREWMAKKRKVRHKEWSEKLNENRQTEFKPFQSNTTGEQTAVTSNKLKISEKERKDNRRTQAKEQMDERLLSAYDLMNEMVTEHAPKRPALITQNFIRNAKQKGAKKTAHVHANNRYKGNNRAIKTSTSNKKSTRKTELKAPMKTRPISASTGLGSPVDRKHERSRDGPVYHYDIEASARQFITRQSYESYRQKLSASMDRSISLKREFYTPDPLVDALLDDVSLSDPLELQNLENFDSLLSGDSELRDLLCDVMAEDRPSLFGIRDDVMSRNSPGILGTVEEKREYATLVKGKGRMLDTFNLGGKESLEHRDAHGRSSVDHLYASEKDDLEMSDEVAALLAEAKAAVGDDFSGTSEVGDIDWNEVNYVLEQDNQG